MPKKGYKQTKEHKKNNKGNTGKHFLGLQKGKKNSFYGKKHTEESNQKNREAHLGKVPWNKDKKGVQD